MEYERIEHMKISMDKVMNLLSDIRVVIAIAALVLLLVILLIVRKAQSNKKKKELQALEVRYNNIKSVPLSFKLNKAVAIARVDQDTMTKVTHSKDDFDQAQANLKQIAQALADTEDSILSGKLKKAKEQMLDLESSVALGEKQVSHLDKFLDSILEKETAQRTEVTELKDRFRQLKTDAQENSGRLNYSWSTIEKNITDIEKMFSAFEEWMYASEFEKASGELENIKTSMTKLDEIIHTLPDLLQDARGVIPNMVEALHKDYISTRSKGVYLTHLDEEKNLGIITNSLKEDLTRLKSGDATDVRAHLDDYKVRIKQLDDAVKKEDSAYTELKSLSDETKKLAEETAGNEDYVKKQYEKVSVRFGLEDMESNLADIKGRLDKLAINRENVFTMITNNEIPATTTLVSMKELNQDLTACNEELKTMRTKLDSAQSDEERANKQLLKLQLIMNEMQVKIRKNKLPSISNSYEEDMNKANEYIHSIAELIKETPLNVELLNATLKDAIDFIYKLYSNVNNVVGTAVMVENTVVFGNKYRSTYADIDSELTRAELCFRNGEYTQALTIAIATIEKIHPGSYEHMIRENAKSAA
jgi:septation ring formation regulator